MLSIFRSMRILFWLTVATLTLLSCNLLNRLPTAVSSTPSLTPHSPEASATIHPPATEPAPSPTVIPQTEAPAPTLPINPTSVMLPSPSPTRPSQLPGSGPLYAVVGVVPGDVLNMRYGPGIGNPILSTIPPYGMGLEIIGAAQKSPDGATWVPVHYQGAQGWVNSRYLAEQRGEVEAELARRANEVIQALKRQDMQALSQLVHSQKGLRFSPYGFVREEDLRFDPPQVAGLMIDQELHTWGTFDGSGEPIHMNFADYYDRFIYDVDFAFPEKIGFNQAIGQGNTINNLGEFYPGASFVEYHFPGFDPQYGGMDWRSLRLVFERSGGTWALVGVIHDEWTI